MMTAFSCLFDDQARQVVEYLKEENRVLREQLRDKYGCRQVRLTDSQRRRLASKGVAVGRRLLDEVTDLFSPDTVLRWYRQLIAMKYDGSPNRKGGRPKVRQEIIDTVLRLARENPYWGFGRIRNYMVYLGYSVGRSTVKRILEDHGICPEPERNKKGTWNDFIRSHMNVLAATDFFSVELLTSRGLVRCMVLFVIDIATRRVQIAGIKAEPDGQWMMQVARNLTQTDHGFLQGKRYLIHDRDPLFTKAFDQTLKAGGTKPLKIARQSPNLNAFAERFIQSVKQECLDRMILSSPKQLEYVLKEYLLYYHRERPHEGLGGRMIDPLPQDKDGQIARFERLGGLLRSYRRVRRAA
jgi:transposase InsO family protein